MSVQVPYHKQFLIGIFLTIILLSVVEIMARAYVYYYFECNYMNSEVYENLDSVFKREMCNDSLNMIMYNMPFRNYEPNQHFDTININNFGFRGDDLNLQEKNTYRIFLVGGSTVFGSGATGDKNTIPGFLQQKFNDEADYSVQVINSGHNGMSSWGEKRLILEKLMDYEPDLVIIYDGWNDLNSSVDIAENGPNLFLEQIADIIRGMQFYKTPSALTLFLHSMSETNGEKEPNLDDARKKAAIWSNRISEVCQIGNKNNFDVILFLQPFVDAKKKKLTENEFSLFKKTSESQSLEYVEFEKLIPELKNECTDAINLTNVFENVSKPIYFDNAHVVDEGNRIIAEEIFSKITPIISKKH